MALIGKIRKQKWLLVGSLAAALVLFIAMLMFDNPNQSFFGGSRTMVGEIEGRKIEYQEFSRTHDMLYRSASSDGFSDRTFLWNFFVEEAIVQKEADAIGLGVSKTELLELQFSEDNAKLSPIISSRYQNPTTRQVDREQLSQLKDIITTGKVDQMIQEGQLVADFKYRWAHQEKEIIKDRLQTKISRMVEKGMYTPNWMAEAVVMEQNQLVDFQYVQIPFDEVQNTELTLSDEDYKAYFEENKNQFQQDEETRQLEYVIFPVLPTAKDSATIRKNIADLVDGFATAEDDSLFVENNYGIIDEAYFKKADLSPAIADTIFNMPVGSVYGPYLDMNSYQAVKLLGKKVIPDSVKARHILRRATDNVSYMAALSIIDSLKNLIETGAASFDSLAANFSEDQSNAAKGGDLGFFGPGMMVKEFNDVCFFKAEPGKLYSVLTQFGLHLIEVTDRKYGSTEPSVQVAYISQNIIPSQETQNAVREQALILEEETKNLEDLRKSAAAKGLDVETSPALKSNDYAVGNLGVGQGSREMVRWAFGTDINAKSADVNDISPQIYSFQNQGEFYINKYVVAGLKSIRPAGIPSWKDVKEEIEPQVINRKKGEFIKGKIAGKTDLGAIASTFSVQVDTATSVSFASAFIQKAGAAEPKVVATAFKIDLNQISEPIVGSSGVFVVKPTNKPAPAPATNIAQVRQSSQQSNRSMARARLIQSLRKSADIEDNRARFF